MDNSGWRRNNKRHFRTTVTMVVVRRSVVMVRRSVVMVMVMMVVTYVMSYVCSNGSMLCLMMLIIRFCLTNKSMIIISTLLS